MHVAGAVDPSNVAMVVLMLVQAVVTWLLLFRDGTKKNTQGAVDAAVAVSAHDSKTASLLSALSTSVDGITKEVASLQAWTREHERADDKFQSRAEEIMKQQADTSTDMKQMLGNLQRQITNVALGIAPAEATPVPASRFHAKPEGAT